MKRLSLILTFFCFVLHSSAQLNMELLSTFDYGPTLNDVWGWVDPDDSTEYALVGLTTGVSIVSLADARNPVEVAYLAGANSTWRDIKTWGNYAYVTNEKSNGVMVIDLSNLPNSATAVDWTPTESQIGGTLSKCHNLYIDENGVCYLSGCNLNSGGIIYVDVDTNPGQPSIIGWGAAVYSHDIYVRDNITYTSEIYRGQFAIYDASDKQNTVFLAAQKTPYNFAHNTWLSDDGNTIFTTDEKANAPVASYDISDLDNIRLLDEFRPLATIGRNVIPHNIHTYNDWLVISYYTDSGIIVDGSRPENMIEVGNFDSYLGGDGGFNGVWGAYPFLPSETVLLSDRQNGLIVLAPTYVRACWLEGQVTEKGSGIPLSGVDVHIDASQENQSSSDFQGNYATGIATAGAYEVMVTKLGYKPFKTTVNLANGVLEILDIELELLEVVSIQGQIIEKGTGNPLSNAEIRINDDFFFWDANSDADGRFTISSAYKGTYDVSGGLWGWKPSQSSIYIDGQSDIIIEVEKGYSDNFNLDLGWISSTDGMATSGNWTLANPRGTQLNSGAFANPEDDIATDDGTSCYVTGNAGGTAGNDDVDDGTVILTSPIMELASFSDPFLELEYWFVNEEGSSDPNDTLVFSIDDGTSVTNLVKISTSASEWKSIQLDLSEFVDLTNNMKLVITASDLPNSGNIVEAGIDGFNLYEGDEDGDGFSFLTDCDDENPDINPDAVEIANNDVDENCDGIILVIDEDGDGFNSDEDCDDNNPDINPDAVEIANNDVDENCDGIILVIDEDGDGFNSDEDCDDENPDINPDAVEIANNDVDENCDGIILVIDEDGDGFNSDEDCDDNNPDINPDAVEIANNDVDENCDGIILVIDEDGDGFNSDEDCDDENPDINPDAVEIANNDIDENCDGIILMIDEDGDGFNSDEDCDDNNPDINPDAVEIANNDVDENCDGIILVIDEDGDGFNSDEDCDDNNPDINPDAVEIANNDVDENCDGIILVIDEDGDGFNSDEDCDDNNPDINPDAVEIPNNGIDEDCDGEDLITNTRELQRNFQLKIAPNPFSDYFELSSTYKGNATLRIFNSLGQLELIEELYLNGTKNRISSIQFGSGIYWIQLVTESGEKGNEKIIKK